MGAVREVRGPAIWRATAVKENKSRASPEAYRRRGSGSGKRTVLSSRGDAARLGWWLADASSSRLQWRLRIAVDADAMLRCRLLRACGTFEKQERWLFRKNLQSRMRFRNCREDTAPMLLAYSPK